MRRTAPEKHCAAREALNDKAERTPLWFITSVDTGVETQGCSYPQACPHMGKVDVGCGEPVAHGSTDDLGRKEERAEALRARSSGGRQSWWVGVSEPF